MDERESWNRFRGYIVEEVIVSWVQALRHYTIIFSHQQKTRPIALRYLNLYYNQAFTVECYHLRRNDGAYFEFRVIIIYFLCKFNNSNSSSRLRNFNKSS